MVMEGVIDGDESGSEKNTSNQPTERRQIVILSCVATKSESEISFSPKNVRRVNGQKAGEHNKAHAFWAADYKLAG